MSILENSIIEELLKSMEDTTSTKSIVKIAPNNMVKSIVTGKKNFLSDSGDYAVYVRNASNGYSYVWIEKLS